MSLVFCKSNACSSSTPQVWFWGSLAPHHSTIKPNNLAILIQGAILAAWFDLDNINSSPGWKAKAVERLCRSRVVDAPETDHNMLVLLLPILYVNSL